MIKAKVDEYFARAEHLKDYLDKASKKKKPVGATDGSRSVLLSSPSLRFFLLNPFSFFLFFFLFIHGNSKGEADGEEDTEKSRFRLALGSTCAQLFSPPYLHQRADNLVMKKKKRCNREGNTKREMGRRGRSLPGQRSSA